MTETSFPVARSTTLRQAENPFSRREGERDNFPDIDLCFKKDVATKQHDSTSSSFVDENNSSFLNMSIDARAALNEHMRYIAKFGIDGEQKETIIEEEEFTKPLNDLDKQWDLFLDDEHEERVMNTSCSFGGDPSFCRLETQSTPGQEECIDVLTDVSQDCFFDTSRVRDLVTPERNRLKTNFVVTRSDDEETVPYGNETLETETSSPRSAVNVGEYEPSTYAEAVTVPVLIFQI